MTLLLGQLCAYLKEKGTCLVLRTKEANPLSSSHDFYLLVPEDPTRKAVVLLLLATSDVLLLGDEDKGCPAAVQSPSISEEEASYMIFIEESMNELNVTKINPNELNKWTHETDAGEDCADETDDDDDNNDEEKAPLPIIRDSDFSDSSADSNISDGGTGNTHIRDSDNYGDSDGAVKAGSFQY